jgi:hypothetical protein
MRKDSSFDDIIRDKLSRVEPTYQPSDWDRMKARLDSAPVAEGEEDAALFDRIVRERAPYSTVQGRSQNWPPLMARLDHIYQRERQVIGSKLIEIAALLLLLIIIDHNFIAVNNGAAAGRFDRNSTVAPPNKQEALAAPAVKQHTDDLAAAILPTNNNNTPSPAAVAEIPTTPALAENAAAGTAQAPLPSTGLTLQPLSSLPFSVFASTMDFNIDFGKRDLGAIALLPRKNHKPEGPALADLKKITPLRPRGHFSLSMFGGYDYNRVLTPDVLIQTTTAPGGTTIYLPTYDRYTTGYSGGATVAFGKNRWEVETGIIYTVKQYQARPVLYVTGSVSEGFIGEGIRDIEMNVAAIPVQFRYDIMRLKRWKLYGSAGASLQVVVESNYAVGDQDAFRSKNFNPAPSHLDSPGHLKTTGLKTKNLDGGWFQGGSFARNSFLTANAALGLEHRLTGRWSVYAQPTYHHSVLYFSKGLGPDSERLHTFSLFSGVRLRL